MATQTSSQDLNNLTINRVTSPEAFEQMISAGVISANEFYLVEGEDETVDWDDITNKPSTFPPPTAADDTLGGIKTNYSASGKNYAIKVDSNGNAYVNVPWTDNNTTSFTITANATDGLWDLTGTSGTNAVTYALAPYSSKKTSASFYAGTTNPTLTTRLNYDGYLYATKLYSGGSEVLTSHQSLDNYKTKQTAITDSTGTSETSTATRFVYSVSQNANGEISVKTRPLPTYAPLASPALTGTPTAPTAAAGTNTTQIATTEFVTSAVTGLAGPMRFIGTLGSGGTATTLAAASADNKGWTYKVIAKGTYQGVYAEVGDLMISNGTAWINVPSGDVPDGTITNIATGSGLTGGPITTSGTISHADTSSQASITANGRKYITGVTLDDFGHVTGLTTGTETVTNTDTLVKQTAKSDNVNYKLLFTTSSSPTSGNAAEAAYDTGITVNPSTDTITATTFAGNASTATSASKLQNTSKIGDTNKPVYFTANGVPSAISYTIDKSVPSTAVFTDTATAVDDILDGSNSGTAITYKPYTSQQSKLSFDTSSTNPSRTDRLNLNGYLYATRLYSGGSQVLTSISATSSGSGNVVTAISASNGAITYTLGEVSTVAAQIIRW